MKNIYTEIKKRYPDYEVLFNEEYGEITITIDNYKILIFEDYIAFFDKGKEITHSHPNNDIDILFIVDDYIKNRATIEKEQQKDNLTFNLTVIIIFAIIIFCSSILLYLTSENNIDFWWLKIIIILATITFMSLVIYGIYKLNIKIKLNRISDKDLESIKQFYNHSISNDELLDDLLYFEQVWFCCEMCLKMRKKIFSKSTFDYDLISNNKKVKEYYKISKLAINSIYKYYDIDGNRKI